MSPSHRYFILLTLTLVVIYDNILATRKHIFHLYEEKFRFYIINNNYNI